IFAGWGAGADIEIVVRKREVSGPDGGQETAIAVERGVEAGFEELLGFWRRSAEGEYFERPDLGDETEQERPDFLGEVRTTVVLAPMLLIAGARKVVEELVAGGAGGFVLDFILLDLPGHSCRFGNHAANVMAVGTEHSGFVLQDCAEIQAVGFQ